jgi:hypothetical protein
MIQGGIGQLAPSAGEGVDGGTGGMGGRSPGGTTSGRVRSTMVTACASAEAASSRVQGTRA